MKSASLFFVVFFFVVACGHSSLAADDEPSNPQLNHYRDGFVVCSDGENDQTVPIYLFPCQAHSNRSLSCGDKVSVVRRYKDVLRILLPNGAARYAAATSISQRPDRFVPFDSESGVPDGGVAECPPQAIYMPGPEYSEKARKKKINGTVVLSLTVGVDGKPRDIKVERRLGYGLDEKAIDAVSRWRFEPALRDGEPFEKQIDVEVSFRLY